MLSNQMVTPRGVSYPQELAERFVGYRRSLGREGAIDDAEGFLDIVLADHQPQQIHRVAMFTRSWLRQAVSSDDNPGPMSPVMYGLIAVEDDSTLLEAVRRLVPIL